MTSAVVDRSRRRLALYESMGRIYSENYRLLLRLFPDLDGDRQPRLLRHPALPGVQLELTAGGGRYTSFLRLGQHLSVQPALLPDLSIDIRIYHDACLAEVVSYQGQGRFLAHYRVPNALMYQAHEKQQVNYFLREWLSHGLSRARRQQRPGAEIGER